MKADNKNMSSDKKPTLKSRWEVLPKKEKVTIFGVLTGLLIVAFIVMIGFSVKTTLENKVTPQSYLQDITTIGDTQPGSLAIAPATAEWWHSLLIFTPNRGLDALDFSTISSGAKYVAFTTSKGTSFGAVDAIGTPSTFVIYNTEAEAKAAWEVVKPYYPSITDKNVLLFAANGAYADIDYALTQFEKTKTKNSTNKMEDIDLKGKASWTLSIEDYTNILMKDSTKLDKEFMTETLTSLGFTKDTVWSGTSTDGLVWNGSFSNFNSGAVKTPTELSNMFFASVDKNGVVVPTPTVAPNTPEGSEVAVGGTIRAQSLLWGCCMAMATETDAQGGITSSDNKTTMISKLDKGKGFYDLKILSSPWQASMRGDINTSYPFAGYNEMDILVKDKTGKATITLIPYPEDFFITESR